MPGTATPSDEKRMPKPSCPREVPAYLRSLANTFFFRLFYIFRLVWEARPTLLFLMISMSVFSGVMPVIGSLISARLLNELARAYSGEFLMFSLITVLLAWQFGYMLFRSVISRIFDDTVAGSTAPARRKHQHRLSLLLLSGNSVITRREIRWKWLPRLSPSSRRAQCNPHRQ